MKRLVSLLVFLAVLRVVPHVSAASPFIISPRIVVANEKAVLRVQFTVPAQHYLYADELQIRWLDNSPLPAIHLPQSNAVFDQFSKSPKHVFDQSFVAECEFATRPLDSLRLEIRYRGCDEANCYFPEIRNFCFAANGVASECGTPSTAPSPSEAPAWREQLADFRIATRGGGYLGENEFLHFLASAEAPNSEASPIRRISLNWLLLVVLGGLALNLTPCVLPTIPINLAIIGAGAAAQSRRRGLILGAVYGAGIAAAYGLLGMLVVTTGSKVGLIQASPWFNLVTAGVFAALALALADRFNESLLGFQPHRLAFAKSRKGSLAIAFISGSCSAVFAGACVAPIVISVLVQASTSYATGHATALALPLLLGLGMGLPWPLIGAGLSFLPKPGRWMNAVKHAFAVLILISAVLYGYNAFVGFKQTSARIDSPGLAPRTLADQLTTALQSARAQGKPVFIDFWGAGARAAWSWSTPRSKARSSGRGSTATFLPGSRWKNQTRPPSENFSIILVPSDCQLTSCFFLDRAVTRFPRLMTSRW